MSFCTVSSQVGLTSDTLSKHADSSKAADPLEDKCKEPPKNGFWKRATGRALADALRTAAFYQLYAVLTGVFVSFVFIHHVVFRVRLFNVLRFALIVFAPMYFSVLAVGNGVVLIVLITVRYNLRRLDDALSSVADAVTAPVLSILPSLNRSISLDELRSRLLASAKVLRRTEAPVAKRSLIGIASVPLTLSSRLILNAAIRSVVRVIETRYASALQAGQHRLNVAVVKRILSGEIVSLLLSPFSATINFYILVTVAEMVVLTVTPFIIADICSL